MSETTPQPLLVVGAGIAGVTAALEAAEAGRDVVLLEKEASIGGRVLQLHHYFPKLCPPSCGMEINTRRLERNPRVRVLTRSEIQSAEDGKVTIRQAPAYVNDRCTACGKCCEVCPAKVADPHDLGMNEVPAIRIPHPHAWPYRYTLDREACPDGCRACVDACAYDAIDLDAKEREETIEVGSVVVATGWHAYPLDKLPELGGGTLPNVISNVQMERLASKTGPTGGKIQRPSDGEAPKKVAFVQCAGSRDRNHLPYCSSVCCLGSFKQALYVQEQDPESEVVIYYIDRRAFGRNEELLARLAGEKGVRLVKGKVGRVEAGEGGALKLRAEDVEAGRLIEDEADLVVLATGMVPNLKDGALPLGLERDEDGFGLDSNKAQVAGVARRPADVATCVRDATGAAARALAAGRA
ncbi:MAG: FAD-dependent oxidoreductase [Acidobacteria bacterium]|jgi:quinone-modifying oxidoreductase subunit QmoA|nr:FAD-dependent oxidoreductase [Acidobacteriota bacterium]